ncbi:Hypothetical predicted protein, partial [Paramuricea clavata]
RILKTGQDMTIKGQHYYNRHRPVCLTRSIYPSFYVRVTEIIAPYFNGLCDDDIQINNGYCTSCRTEISRARISNLYSNLHERATISCKIITKFSCLTRFFIRMFPSQVPWPRIYNISKTKLAHRSYATASRSACFLPEMRANTLLLQFCISRISCIARIACNSFLAKEAADEKTADVEEIIATGSEKARTFEAAVHNNERLPDILKSIIIFEPRADAEAASLLFEMKLPPEICEKWELEISYMDDEKVDLDLFLKFLNKQVKRVHQVLDRLDGILDITDDILVYGVGTTEENANADHDKKWKCLLERYKESGVALNSDNLN